MIMNCDNKGESFSPTYDLEQNCFFSRMFISKADLLYIVYEVKA